jgi:hypothetical protein
MFCGVRPLAASKANMGSKPSRSAAACASLSVRPKTFPEKSMSMGSSANAVLLSVTVLSAQARELRASEVSAPIPAKRREVIELSLAGKMFADRKASYELQSDEVVAVKGHVWACAVIAI